MRLTPPITNLVAASGAMVPDSEGGSSSPSVVGGRQPMELPRGAFLRKEPACGGEALSLLCDQEANN